MEPIDPNFAATEAIRAVLTSLIATLAESGHLNVLEFLRRVDLCAVAHIQADEQPVAEHLGWLLASIEQGLIAVDVPVPTYRDRFPTIGNPLG
ncbi:hypothetical protein AVW16_06670 [Crenobacter luteus]|uniref:Uncharacterized protein n=2 Tax=Crenobacter luteus TaxID=1452487 RepID=A0A161SD24_9NEIS|nr:hypothetical protein AVW16_06670 [Crenobacter luteus]